MDSVDDEWAVLLQKATNEEEAGEESEKEDAEEKEEEDEAEAEPFPDAAQHYPEKFKKVLENMPQEMWPTNCHLG